MSSQQNNYTYYIKWPETGFITKIVTNINFVMSFTDWLQQIQRKKEYNLQGMWLNPFSKNDDNIGVLKFVCGET